MFCAAVLLTEVIGTLGILSPCSNTPVSSVVLSRIVSITVSIRKFVLFVVEIDAFKERVAQLIVILNWNNSL